MCPSNFSTGFLDCLNMVLLISIYRTWVVTEVITSSLLFHNVCFIRSFLSSVVVVTVLSCELIHLFVDQIVIQWWVLWRQ